MDIFEHAPKSAHLTPTPCLQRCGSRTKAKEINVSDGERKGTRLCRACCATLLVWYTTHSGKRYFTCIDPLPVCRFWLLLCHPEDEMIRFCSFYVVCYKVALLLDVTLKMFGPWAIDHSKEEKDICIPHRRCVWFSGQANWMLNGDFLLRVTAETRANNMSHFAMYIRPPSSLFGNQIPVLDPITEWVGYDNYSLGEAVCQKPPLLMIGDSG